MFYRLLLSLLHKAHRWGRRFACPQVLALAILSAVSCARKPATLQLERLAILRFENLGPDASADWIGRALPEIIAAELPASSGLQVILSGRLHSFDRSLGVRPISAPGISAERTQALVSDANRLGYGDYSIAGGKLQARLTIENPQTGKMTRVISASAAANDVVTAATELARQISAAAVPYPTRNADCVKAFAAALESSNPAATEEALDQAIAADPNFGPAYRMQAELKAPRDREAAVEILDHALARGNGIAPAERARLQLVEANLRNNPAAAEQALAALVKLDPSDPAQWVALGQAALNRRDYQQYREAFRRVLELQPNDINALNQLGYAYTFTGDFEAGMASLRRYQSLRPNDPNTFDSMGDLNLMTGRFRQAEDYYLQATKKDPAFLDNADFFKAAVSRLMTGDIAGADALAKQYAGARTAARDVAVPFRQAEWLWISGRRKDGYRTLAAFAQRVEGGPLRPLASRAYAELAVWSLMLGNGADAAQMAQKSVALATPATANMALLARFLAQPPASAEEWTARATRLLPNPAQIATRDLALSLGLLLSKEFEPAAEPLKRLLEVTGSGIDEGTPVLLAWSDLQNDRDSDAAALLKFSPVPPATGVSAFMSFYFPRFFYLRGLAAAKSGRQDEARDNYKLFLQLSGDAPFQWGEEKAAAQVAR